MNEKMTFLKILSEIDGRYIYEASQPWKKRKMFDKASKALFAAAVAGLFIFVSAVVMFREETVAAWERFTTIINEILGIEEDASSYVEIMGKSISHNGVTVKLEEAALNKNELWLAYATLNESKEKKMPVLFTEVQVNNKTAQLLRTYTGSDNDNTKDKVREQVSCFLLEKDIEDAADVEIKIQTMDPENEEIMEEYIFSFSASPEELEGRTREIPLNLTAELPDGREFALTKIRWNVFDSTIYGYLDSISDGEEEFYLIGKDNLGNPVQYMMRSYENPEILFQPDFINFQPSVLYPDVEYLELQLYILREDQKKPVYQTADANEAEFYIEGEGRVYEEGEDPLDGAVPVSGILKVPLQ